MHHHARRSAGFIAALAAGTLIVAGCTDDGDNDNAAATATTGPMATMTTTAGADETTTGAEGGTTTGTAGANLADFRGINIGGDDSRTLSGFTVDAVSVHDVTGLDNWVGGSTSRNKTGIHFAMGWDRAKNTGGIVFNTTVPNIAAPPSTPTALSAQPRARRLAGVPTPASTRIHPAGAWTR